MNRREDTELHDEDAIEVGRKVVEMADRVWVMHSVMPGAVAAWCFGVDGRKFKVSVTPVTNEEGSKG